MDEKQVKKSSHANTGKLIGIFIRKREACDFDYFKFIKTSSFHL